MSNVKTITFPLNLVNLVELEFPISKNLFWFFARGMFLAILFLSVFYLFQIEGLTKGNYLIKIEQEKIEKLQEENLFLEKEYARLFTLKNLEQEIKILGLVNVSEIQYISLSGERLVQKNH
jgi:hypothetical protein